LNQNKKLFEKFVGKKVKLIVKNSDGTLQVWRCKVVDVTPTHLFEQDRFGRLHAVRYDLIVKITERRDEPCSTGSKNG